MTWVAVAVGGASLVGSAISSGAQSEATAAGAASSAAAIAEQTAARESFEERTQPFAELGLEAADPLRELLGLGGGDPLSQLGEINPLVSFLRDEGFTQIQESAAARGRLGAGGTLQDLTRFNTNLASTIVPQLQNQRFNQLFNLVGLGANVTAGQGTAGLQTATNISGILGQEGIAQGQAAINQGNIQSNALGQLAGIFGAQQGGAFGTQTTQPAPTAVPETGGPFGTILFA